MCIRDSEDTALGAVVNLAARIEGLNKAYGTRILASDAVVAAAGDGRFVFREVDVVSPSGTTRPTTLFELVGEVDTDGGFALTPARQREMEDWAACYALYRARAWGEARDAFAAHRALAADPALADVYIRRCDTFLAPPPAADWDGVFAFKTK